MDFQNIAVEERIGATGIITIDRPSTRNALNRETTQEIARALAEMAQDEAIRVMIITGAGDQAFASGADLDWLLGRTPLETLDWSTQDLCNSIETFPKPVIAAINGYALGGGCELALACDIRVASEHAKLGQPEVRFGILPGGGGTQRLPRLVGLGKAKELVFTGAILDAREAERIGLVDRVVPHSELRSAVLSMADRIARQAPLAVRLAKQALNLAAAAGNPAGIWGEKLAQAILMGSEDKIEGINAFREKREAAFRGR